MPLERRVPRGSLQTRWMRAVVVLALALASGCAYSEPDIVGLPCPCPAGYGCADGTCIPTGGACGWQGWCPDNETCVDGVCRLWCGPDYPNNVCPTGTQCQQDATCR